jgi:hypothetical protein
MTNLPTNVKTTEVHISQIMKGDTILHNGQMTTVSQNDIKNCPFMGRSLFGDSYNGGRKLVKRITFLVPTNNGIVER